MSPEKSTSPRSRSSQSPWPFLVSAAMGPVTILAGYWMFGGFSSSAPSEVTSQDDPKPIESPIQETVDPKSPAAIPPNSSKKTDVSDTVGGSPQTPIPTEPPVAPPVVQSVTIPEVKSLEDFAKLAPTTVLTDGVFNQRFPPIPVGAFLLIQYADEERSANLTGDESGQLVFVGLAGQAPLVIPRRTSDVPFLWRLPNDISEWHLQVANPTSANNVAYRIAVLGNSESPAEKVAATQYSLPPLSQSFSIPSRSERLSALAEVRKVYRDQLNAAKTSEAKMALARKYMEQYRETEDPGLGLRPAQ